MKTTNSSRRQTKLPRTRKKWVSLSSETEKSKRTATKLQNRLTWAKFFQSILMNVWKTWLNQTWLIWEISIPIKMVSSMNVTKSLIRLVLQLQTKKESLLKNLKKWNRSLVDLTLLIQWIIQQFQEKITLSFTKN